MLALTVFCLRLCVTFYRDEAPAVFCRRCGRRSLPVATLPIMVIAEQGNDRPHRTKLCLFDVLVSDGSMYKCMEVAGFHRDAVFETD